MKQQHTPVPWLLQEGPETCFHDGNEFSITDSTDLFTIAEVWPTSHGADKADAEFILRAVNNHDKMLEALREVIDIAAKLHDRTLPFDDETRASAGQICDTANNAIAEVEG